MTAVWLGETEWRVKGQDGTAPGDNTFRSFLNPDEPAVSALGMAPVALLQQLTELF
jgi:hypothetical protein